MRVHLVQYDIVWEDKPANHTRVRRMLTEAGVMPGDVVMLPEMFDSGFSMNTEITAADPGTSISFLSEVARELRVYVLASIATRLPSLEPPRDCVNRAVLVGPTGEVRLEVDKVHPFSFGREAERFVGGDQMRVAEVGEGQDAGVVCPVVCYDLRFPECFRAGVDLGAEVFCVIANWPEARQEHWRALCIARAIENQACVLGLNRSGSDPKLAYAGGSIVVDAQGRVLAEAGSAPVVLSQNIDLRAIREWRRGFPALSDRKAWVIGPEGGVRTIREKGTL